MPNLLRHIGRSFAVPAALSLSLLASGALSAQTPAADPTDRLREVLPADVAERVIARIAAARSVELPAAALENRALKFAARGVPPQELEIAIREHADRLAESRDILREARTDRPRGDEIEAGAEAMRQGVDGEAVSALARSAPSGRSLAVPLFVIGSLVERGMPSDAALARVRERLLARATDAELERMPGEHGRDRRVDTSPVRRPTEEVRPRPRNVPPQPERPVTPSPRRP